jgi:AAHS family 4-hydroxybenzoate transporter-like MFS transporter
MLSPAPHPAKIDISALIDSRSLSAFQIGLFILCGVCLMLDGFDVQAMGYAGPALKPEWHISDPAFGRLLSAALKGVLVGSIFLSMLADKIGRRPILIGSCLFFSVTTIATARAANLDQLLVIRFIAGIGLGAIMPNSMALVSEYTPRRLRVVTMMIVSNGFTLGAALGGFLASWMIPHFGWRSIFYFGGALPLAGGVVMIFMLPESLQFLVLKRRRPEQILAWLKRIDPEAVADSGTSPVEFVVPEQSKPGFTFWKLFHEGRATGTLLIWLAYFMNLLNLYFLQGWLPTIAKTAGFSTSTAVLIGTMNQVGGFLGALVLGWFVRRSGFAPVLATCFAVASVSILMIGHPGLPAAMLFAMVFISGFGVTGGQAGVNALTGTYYPTDLRSTGLGAGLGIGRIGSIVGPELAGDLLGRHWSTQQLFVAAAVPALTASGVMLAMGWVLRRSGYPSGERMPSSVRDALVPLQPAGGPAAVQGDRPTS